MLARFVIKNWNGGQLLRMPWRSKRSKRLSPRVFAFMELEDRSMLSGYLGAIEALGSAGSERMVDVAIDAKGGVFTAGHFRGTVDFDPGPGTYNNGGSHL